MTSKATRRAKGTRGRGTQAERSDDTRERVITAAVDCIAESGYKHASVTRIAERSGVSWGGIQHHFGTKDAIIQAVLDHALDEFLLDSRRISPTADTLENRVKVLVEGAWRLVNRPGFRAFFEIMLSHRYEPPRRNPARRYRARVWNVIIAAWDHLFGHLQLSQEQVELARRVTFTTLGGMVVESIMRTDAPDFDGPLAVLQDNLLRLLRAPKSTSRARSFMGS
ncbi:MAG: TetR/AcrR family transcriptional regulator [Deltaproteobacteria bacterium]|nr:TetR/AcrR family transcriptional regulator [Deltaproteobacteria bacterium]